MNKHVNSRDHEYLTRLVEALTANNVDGMRPIDWTGALASMCCSEDLNKTQDEDRQAWCDCVTEVASMVRQVRLILSAYRDTLPVAVAVHVSDELGDEEIPF